MNQIKRHRRLVLQEKIKIPVKLADHEGLGRLVATSRQSKPLSQDSIGSPEAYLIDSLSSIFLKRQPAKVT